MQAEFFNRIGARSGHWLEFRLRPHRVGSKSQNIFHATKSCFESPESRCSPRLHRRNTGVPSSSNPRNGRKAGAPDKIRTCGLCLRRAALYPAELRVPGRVSPNGRLAATLPLCQPNKWGQPNNGPVADRRLVLRPVLANLLDLLEFAETARGARVQPAGGVVEHADDVDIAQLVGRRLAGKGLLEGESGALVRQPVAVDIAIAHLEIDRLAVDHLGRTDAGAYDAALRFTNHPDFIVLVYRRLAADIGSGRGTAAGGKDRTDDDRNKYTHESSPLVR